MKDKTKQFIKALSDFLEGWEAELTAVDDDVQYYPSVDGIEAWVNSELIKLPKVIDKDLYSDMFKHMGEDAKS